MFEAILLICAATANFEVRESTCFTLSDQWGPYITEENCGIRANQMVNDATSDNSLSNELMRFLGNPEQMYVEGQCFFIGGTV